jgi:hypothetical protein
MTDIKTNNDSQDIEIKLDNIVNNNFDKVKELFKSEIETLSLETIVDFIPHLIKYVESYKKLKGNEKKLLVLKLIRYIIDNTDGFGDDEIVDPILKLMVPSIIDNLIKVDQNHLRLKKQNKCFKLLMGCKIL